MKKYPETLESFEKDYKNKYFCAKAILDADELTVVLRGHLLAESLIEKFLKDNLKEDIILKDRNFEYFQKIELLYSLGYIRKEIFTILQLLGEIRNKYAHHLGISFNDIDELISDFINRVKFVNPRMEEMIKKYNDDHKLLFGLGVQYLLGYFTGAAFNIKK